MCGFFVVVVCVCFDFEGFFGPQSSSIFLFFVVGKIIGTCHF